MSRHKNLVTLAEKNAALLEKLNFDPRHDDPFELDNSSAFRESDLFTSEAIDCIFGDKEHAVADEANYIAPTVGMLLIRPDMIQIAPLVESFLSDRMQLRDSFVTNVTPDRYWKMYGDAVVGRETRESRLTRAAVYIGTPCRGFIYESLETDRSKLPVADYVFDTLKGKQGVQQNGTLRGELVYNEALSLGFHSLDDPEIALAVDPFGAYRKIVREGRESPCHELSHPLLFFTGVGIHVPNYQELQRDLPLLVTAHESEDNYRAA